MYANCMKSACQGVGVWAIMAAQHRRHFPAIDGRQPSNLASGAAS
jgi:hypothetical protein